MPRSWSTLGVDLHLELGARGVRAGLESALRNAIRDGRLHPETRLPSSRTLAVDLGIARNTVSEVYGQLVAEGWLTAVGGSGTRVADRVAPAEEIDERPVDPVPLRYSLRAGSPDVSRFPRQEWLRATRQALATAPDSVFGYGEPQGRPELRRALAEYLSRARGLRLSAGRIFICAGFGHALQLLSRVLAARGCSTLAVEEYGLPEHRHIATVAGLRPATLAVDDRGACVDSLDRYGAVLLTPAHQFPLGAVLAPERRAGVVEWAARGDSLVIEDDYDGEFRYDRQPVGALQALSPERVAYIGTASKALAPGLRLAWLVVPPDLTDEVVAAKAGADPTGSTIDQVTLAHFIESGSYDRHVRRCRLAYRRRRDRLVTALGSLAPAGRVLGVAAGLHAVVELGEGLTEAELIAAAARNGLDLEGLEKYRSTPIGTRPPALVVGYGTPPEHDYTAALARLCAVMAGRPSRP